MNPSYNTYCIVLLIQINGSHPLSKPGIFDEGEIRQGDMGFIHVLIRSRNRCHSNS